MVSNTELRDEARELGRQAREQMDPLCEDHLRALEYHPTHDEFSNTRIYKEFMDLVYRLAEQDENLDAENLSLTTKEELIWELREPFDDAYLSPSRKEVECVQCLHDGDIQIRVNNPEELRAEAFLEGHVQSGHASDDDDMNAYR